ncbi:TPA: type 1 glutamine amidotransferase [Pseudomonas aeruginosa]|uniref:type 1 glutamine amidotransferase n=1 Tax=Pseudomonas aeruginosa TaxID=287 RepID=UPI00053D7152|nr:type 1 glutamine amidotransferase [Pseudomonas aeruginosa]
MRALVLQHVPFEGSARIGDWVGRHCEHEHVCYLYADAHLPALDSFDLLVVMGGPMSVHDEAQYPWLVAEKRLIRAALDAGKKVLGICLGAQLLAQALGAAVRPGRQAEIGWWPLHRYSQALGSPLGERLPERLMAFHWHGETFDLPAGSVPLYGSAACANQGFIWNEQAIGLQCHLESTAESIEALLDACPQDLQREGAVQSAGRIRQGVAHCREVAPVLFLLLDYLAHRPAEIARRA